ncbi:MAG: glycosyl hydrolase [Candidatus Omnitrophota bacterium]
MSLISKKISNPDSFFRLVPMWYLNGEFDEDETRRQIAEMKKKGIGGVMPIPITKNHHCFPGAGMNVEYLSKDYFKQYGVIVDECRKQNMKIWVWDDVFCPSGKAGDKVIKANPALRPLVLKKFRKGKTPKHKCCRVIHRDSEDWFYEEPGGDYPVDLLRKETTETFLKITYEPYFQHFGNEFGKTIIGFFTDEVRYAGCINGIFRIRNTYYEQPGIPWRQDFPAFFKKRYGYILLPRLKYLFAYDSGNGPEAQKVREDFADLVTTLFADNYLKPLRVWCRRHGVYLMGHLNNDDFLDANLRGGGDYLYQLKQFDVPGIDVVTRQIFPDKERRRQNTKSYDFIRYNSNFPKLASSAAHQKNSRYALCEIFDAFGFGLTLAEMKWLVNYHIVRGINMFVPASLNYSTKNGAVVSTCSYQGKGNPQWEFYKPFADYAARACYLTSLGRPDIDTAVLYPISTLWREKNKRLNDSFESLMVYLQIHGVDFDLFSSMDMENAGMVGNGLRQGKMLYKKIYLCNDTKLNQNEKAFFEKLAGKIPVYTPKYLDIKGAIKYKPAALSYDSKRMQIADYGLTMYRGLNNKVDAMVDFGKFRHMRFIKRGITGGSLYYFFNESTRETYRGTIKLREMGDIFRIDLENGQIRKMERCGAGNAVFKTELRIALNPSEALCVVIADKRSKLFQAGKIPTGTLVAKKQGKELDFDGDWTISMVSKTTWTRKEGFSYTTPSQQVKTNTLKDWSETFGETFTGIVKYKNEFTLSNLKDDIQIQFVQINHNAEVMVNGRKIGTLLDKPYKLQINKHYLLPGKNRLEILVGNTLANLARSSDFKKKLKEFHYENCYYAMTEDYDRENLKSGIFGVRIWSC